MILYSVVPLVVPLIYAISEVWGGVMNLVSGSSSSSYMDCSVFLSD